MSTPGLLFLLLMSFCLAVLSAPPDTSVETDLVEGQLKQGLTKNDLKTLSTWFKKHHQVIGELLKENVDMIPVVGPYLARLIKTLMVLTPQAETLEAIKSDLQVLNFKIDNFHSEMKWDAWAAGAYQITVNNIEKALIKYTELERSYDKSTNTEKEALKKTFFTFYSQYADSTLVLHQFLTAKPASITQNLGDLLAERLRCHEKDVKAKFLYLNTLMYKGNVLNEKYHEFKGTNTDASVKTALEIASQSASALIKSHQRCLSNSNAYIERDIFERIDVTKKHQKIADSVMDFLAKTYDRYDWIVVAFTTLHSKHDLQLLNRHTFSGFTEVERGTVTVAVAKQVKGGHTKTTAVKDAIKKCLPKHSPICFDVVKKLVECQETIFGKRLSQTLTAVHAYKRKSQTSANAVEAPNDNDSAIKQSSSLTPHLFEGKCGNLLGKFMVIVKSDEELLRKEDLCSNVNCGKKGKCVVVPETFIAMCECQYPYYGERCDMSLESDKRPLQKEPIRRTQTPEQVRKSKSVPPGNRRSLQSNSQRSATRKSRKSNSQRSSSRKSRKSNSQRPSSRKSRKSNSQRPSSRKSRKSNSQRSSSRKSRKSNSQRSSSRKSRKSNSQRSSSRKSRKSPPERSAQGHDSKSFCGSLCEDVTTKTSIS